MRLHEIGDAVLERGGRARIAGGPELLEARLREVLVPALDRRGHGHELAAGLAARGAVERCYHVAEAAGLTAPDIEESVHVGMVIAPKHDIHAIADIDEVALLAAVRHVLAIRAVERRGLIRLGER